MHRAVTYTLSFSSLLSLCHGVTVRQAVAFLKIFVCLLRERALSHTGLKRLAVGLQMALLMDSPKGLCAVLAQREYELLAELLEALSTFQESAGRPREAFEASKRCVQLLAPRVKAMRGWYLMLLGQCVCQEVVVPKSFLHFASEKARGVEVLCHLSQAQKQRKEAFWS